MSSSWKNKSGRKKGHEGYVFGDITRSILQTVVSKDKGSGKEKQIGHTKNISNSSKSNADLLHNSERLAQLEELEKFHKTLDDEEVDSTTKLVEESKKALPSPISVPAMKPISLSGVCWPDPDPVLMNPFDSIEIGAAKIDNVTRMSSANIDRIFFPRCAKDVQKVLLEAYSTGHKIAMRGTKHSMGGQTIANKGYIIDTAKMKQIKDINQKDMTVVVGPGTLWSDLIYELNKYGLSPRTMQSYATFSVGGAISVNAHGITTDFSMVESVLSMKVVKWDGTIVECSRKAEGEGKDLFSLAIGGYGMFGVIVEVTLKIVDNVNMSLEVMTNLSIDEFLSVYQSIHIADDVEVKLGRIDITNFEKFQMFVFRRASPLGVRTVSHLPLEPKEMSKISQLLYKWVLPSGYSVRKAMEEFQGSAMDFTSEPTERNFLMYESADPLVKLYNPLFEMDDTFVLQEYFLAPSQFRSWINRAKVPLMAKYDLVTLLNCTIRYVECDEVTTLVYSRNKPDGSFAFVLYYRLKRTPEADECLRSIHNALVEITLSLQGRFYLPYRHHYTFEQLDKAYPQMRGFFQRKMHYDPHNLFESAWSIHYGKAYLPEEYWTQKVVSHSELSLLSKAAIANNSNEYRPRIVEEFRSNSYRKLMANPDMKKKCYEQFIHTVLNLETPTDLQKIISHAVWDSLNKDDFDIYDSIANKLADIDSGVMGQLKKAWKSTKQLQQQRSEFTRELAAILSRLNRLGLMRDYVSVGDNGKMVLTFKETLGINGKAYIVHNVNNDHNAPINVILERGSQVPVGHHVFIDYENPVHIDIPDESADILTLMGGLHHYPQDKIPSFISEVGRILRPGGLFILREHDATPELIPLLDVAHSLFNAVTGEPLRTERQERRAFRPILEWREIVESSPGNLKDVMLYEVQRDDPTIDEMMVFVKDSLEAFVPRVPAVAEVASPAKQSPSPAVSKLDSMMNNVPKAILEAGRSLLDSSISMVEKVETSLLGLLENKSQGQKFAATRFILSQITPIKSVLIGLKPYADSAKLKEATSEDFIPRELFILLDSLFTKANKNEASAAELFVVSMIIDLQTVMRSEESHAKKHKDSVSPASPGASAAAQPPVRKRAVSASEVILTFNKLLVAYPDIKDLSFISKAGLTYRAQVLLEGRFKDVQMTGENLAQLFLPYLDEVCWKEMAPMLDELIQNPTENPLHMDNLVDKRSPWWHCAMAFLGSPYVRPNSYALTAASWSGFRPIVEMWQVAQQSRRQSTSKSESAQLEGDESSLSANAKAMLGLAAKLASQCQDETSFDALARCLSDVGFIDEEGKSDEFTWFRLPEWMQVEMIHKFSAFLENEPWFRYPFFDIFKTYLSVLFQEAQVVQERHGFRKAFMSWGFIINFVPAIVMASIFGQLYTLALPCRMALGDSYTAEQLSELVMELVVLVEPSEATAEPVAIDWRRIDDRIKSKPILQSSGLHMLTVPAMFPFTEVVVRLAERQDLRIIRISSHDEVQVRIALSITTTGLLERINHMKGVSIKFQFDMPTVSEVYDGRATMPKVLNLALGIQVPHLLECIRAFKSTEGIKIIQIYCFWN